MPPTDDHSHHTAKLAALRRKLEHLLCTEIPQPPPRTRKGENARRHRTRLDTCRTDPIHYPRDLPRLTPAQNCPSNTGPIPLQQAVTGEESIAPNGDPLFLACNRLEHLDQGDAVNHLFHAWLQQPGAQMRQQLTPILGDPPWNPAHFLFMDVETTGLGCSPVFLIGIMLYREAGLETRQFLARDYAEEAAIITAFVDVAQTCQVLVTFNGKSFDVPFLKARAATTGVAFATPAIHLDLLHISRRVWRHLLPDCKLQTLEQHICGRIRHGDIPGAEIPEVYHTFVRTGNAAKVGPVMTHNMLDLVTLADLLARHENAGNGVSTHGCRPLSG